VVGQLKNADVADMQVVNKILYSSSSDHTARAWLKDIGEPLQVYKGNKMPVSTVVYYQGTGECCRSKSNQQIDTDLYSAVSCKNHYNTYVACFSFSDTRCEAM